MNLFAISCLILISPTLTQIVLGSILVFKRTKRNFDSLCIINMIAQVVTVIIALKIIETDTQNAGVRCGMPQAAMMFLGIVCIIVLVIIIGTQIVVRKYRSQKVRE